VTLPADEEERVDESLPDRPIDPSGDPSDDPTDGASEEGVVDPLADVPDPAESFAAVPDLVPTGDAGVDAALEELRTLPERPVELHVETYTRVHETLRHTLADAGRQDA